MKSLFKGQKSSSSLRWQLVKTHDKLGFRSFTEGRVSKMYERLQAKHYAKIDSRRSSKKWAAEFVDQIFRLTHVQWTYRNNYLHYRSSDNTETTTEYASRMRRIEAAFERVDPETLLAEDQYLVQEYDLTGLAAATTSERIVWEESLKSAQSAAFFERMREVLEDTGGHEYGDLQTSYFNPPPVVEKRKKRHASFYR